jgi:hypothetical protein
MLGDLLAYRMLMGLEAMQAVSAHIMRKATVVNDREIKSYFEYSQSGVQVVEDGLKEISFGEYLVEEQVLDRFQLFRALQMQDRLPGVRLGECAAALGYAPINAIEKIYARFLQISTVQI